VTARRLPLLGALLALGVVACSSAPPPPELPPPLNATVSVRYQLGGPLRGTDAPGAALADEAFLPSRALAVKASVLVLAKAPELGLASAVDKAKLVVLEAASERVVAATPHKLAAARTGPLLDPDALELSLTTGIKTARVVRSLRACLPAGATLAIELARDSESPGDDPEGGRSRAAVLVSRRPDDRGLELALEHGEAGQGGEVVSLEGPDFESPLVARFAALVPSPFGGDAQLLFIIQTAPGPVGLAPGAQAHETALADARRELLAQATSVAVREAPPEGSAPLPDLAATRRALDEPRTARRALYTLATATGSRLAEEVAVTVDDLSFAPLASSVSAALANVTAAQPAREVGLVVEKAALARCREVLESDDVPDDLLAALERRGGAALDLLPSLGAELDRARSLDELEKTLETQNIQLLEDASPRIRVRAARWLAPRIDLLGYTALDLQGDGRNASAKRREVVNEIKKRRGR